jgi:hypothetical protein
MLVLIDVPLFLLNLVSYFLSLGFANLDPVGHMHRSILISWLGGSCLLAIILLWRGKRWQTARVLTVAVLSLSWFGVSQMLPRLWPNPLTYETCMARNQGEYQASYCGSFHTRRPR